MFLLMTTLAQDFKVIQVVIGTFTVFMMDTQVSRRTTTLALLRELFFKQLSIIGNTHAADPSAIVCSFQPASYLVLRSNPTIMASTGTCSRDTNLLNISHSSRKGVAASFTDKLNVRSFVVRYVAFWKWFTSHVSLLGDIIAHSIGSRKEK